MSEPIQLKVINGRFNPEEATPILTGIINAKLQNHARKIALHDQTEEGIKASETRIKQLEEDLRQSLRFLREAAQRGSRVDIDGVLTIREVPQ